MKSTIIFKSNEPDDEKKYPQPPRLIITIPKDEYYRSLKSAYDEGRNDLLKEQNDKEDKNKLQKQWRQEVQKKGRQEAIQTQAKEEEANRQRLKAITARHDIELMRTKSIFPFTIFTDTLIIDTTKVTIAKKQLFGTEYITTIPLKDIADVVVQTVMFLAAVTISYMPQAESGGNKSVDAQIDNLPRKEAIKVKNILKGVLVAKAEEINIANLSPKELAEILQKFGKSKGII